MTNDKNNIVYNQFIIYFEFGTVFQSYSSIIAIEFTGNVKNKKLKNKIVLGRDYDYSRTTGKYRNIFLSEILQETREKIINKTHLYSYDLV